MNSPAFRDARRVDTGQPVEFPALAQTLRGTRG